MIIHGKRVKEAISTDNFIIVNMLLFTCISSSESYLHIDNQENLNNAKRGCHILSILNF